MNRSTVALRAWVALSLLTTAACLPPPPVKGEDGGVTKVVRMEPTRRSWWQFGFEDEVLDQVTLHYLGQAWHQSADVAEVLETVGRINEKDPSSWPREWTTTAARLTRVAQTSEAAGHRLSASQAWLRAATYYRAALHRHPDPFAAEIKTLAQREVEAFEKYLTLSRSPCRAVKMPYEGTTLPGYYCVSSAVQGRGPVLIFQEGRDGWAEDGRFIADEALKRGFHVLLFDGPGMGQTIRLQNLPFRPDWEKVITPVVDFVIAQPEVDASRVGLMSVSMGGFLGPRAATREHRLKVLIANPGVLRWSSIYEGFISSIDPSLLTLLDADPAAFDATMMGIMSQSELLRWGMTDSAWHHGVRTPSELMREVRKYNLDESVRDITARTLVIDADAEEWGQSRALADALTAPHDLLRFTAEEGAQFHVQPGASGIAIRILDWLEGAL